MFYYLKLKPLVTATLGFILAFEINLATQNQKFDYLQTYSYSQTFSAVLQPPIIHEFISKPKISIIMTELDLI